MYALKPNDLQFVFLSSFPCLTKPKHWTPELQRQLAVKRDDRMFVNLPRQLSVASSVDPRRTTINKAKVWHI
jgi:hypothetical protein